MNRGRVLAIVMAATGLSITLVFAVAPARTVGARRSARSRAVTALEQQCPEPYSEQRDPSNPLGLPVPPGPNPLTGAHFFVPGPARGNAASAIARLVGIRPASQPDSESWVAFRAKIDHRLRRDRRLRHKVLQLSKIASQPEAQRISAYSRGGGPDAAFLQTQKIVCKNIAADPGSIPIINTYFLHPTVKDHCPRPSDVRAAEPLFKRRVNEFAAAIDRRPAVLLLETDGLGSSSCVWRRGALGEWERMLRYEVQTVAAL